MQFIQNASLLFLSAFVAASVAVPAPADGILESTIVEPASLEARANSADVSVFSGDICNGNVQNFRLLGGGDRCVPYTNVRSIRAEGSGCTIRTWSGNNCRGSSANIRYGQCTSVLFASVSVQC